MTYTPPTSPNVDFNIGGTYIWPTGVADFDLGGTAPHEIISHGAQYDIRMEKAEITELLVITSDEVKVTTHMEHYYIEVLEEIISHTMKVAPRFEQHLIQYLPDIISHTLLIDVGMDVHQIGGGQSYNLAYQKASPGYRFPWGDGEVVDEHLRDKWGDGEWLDPKVRVPIPGFDWQDYILTEKWIALPWKDNHVSIPWGKFSYADWNTGASWDTLIPTDHHAIALWGGLDVLEHHVLYPYKEPGPWDRFHLINWTPISQQSITFGYSWDEPGQNDERHQTQWGPIDYFQFCADIYWPPPGDDVNLNAPGEYGLIIDNPYPTNPDDYAVDFVMTAYSTDPRCPFEHNETGPRDGPGTGGPIDIIDPQYQTVPQRFYYMLNTCLVKTVLTSDNIEVIAVSATIDKSSWLWQFSITIGAREYLDLIMPQVSGGTVVYTDIEININGNKWICRPEEYTESRAFGKDAWTVTGRSPSMELGAPQCQQISYTYNSLSSGAQIIDKILGTGAEVSPWPSGDLGWEMNWDYYIGDGQDIPEIHTGFTPYINQNWDIPADVYSWSQATQIEAIKPLTESIGAFIYTEPNCVGAEMKLYAKPKFDLPPWYWEDQNTMEPYVQHYVQEATFRDVGRNFVSKPTYTGVHIIGQAYAPAMPGNGSAGTVHVTCHRDTVSQANAVYAPQISDPWLTTYQASMERGRMILCETGEWLQHTIKLFSLATFGDSFSNLTHLVKPGDYISVTEKGTVWTGNVEGVTVDVTVVNGAAVDVSQTVTVNQYLGEKS